MSITTRSQEKIRQQSAKLVGQLKELGIKKVSWTIYDNSDESNLVDVICDYGSERVEQGIEEESILWDISGLFLSETGMFEVDVDAGSLKRLGDAYIPEGLEYDFYEEPETLGTDFV